MKCYHPVWIAAVDEEAAGLPSIAITGRRGIAPEIEMAITRLSRGDRLHADVAEVYGALLDVVDPMVSDRVAALVARIDELIELRTCAAFALGVAAGKRVSREEIHGDR